MSDGILLIYLPVMRCTNCKTLQQLFSTSFKRDSLRVNWEGHLQDRFHGQNGFSER